MHALGTQVAQHVGDDDNNHSHHLQPHIVAHRGVRPFSDPAESHTCEESHALLRSASLLFASLRFALLRTGFRPRGITHLRGITRIASLCFASHCFALLASRLFPTRGISHLRGITRLACSASLRFASLCFACCALVSDPRNHKPARNHTPCFALLRFVLRCLLRTSFRPEESHTCEESHALLRSVLLCFALLRFACFAPVSDSRNHTPARNHTPCLLCFALLRFALLCSLSAGVFRRAYPRVFLGV